MRLVNIRRAYSYTPGIVRGENVVDLRELAQAAGRVEPFVTSTALFLEGGVEAQQFVNKLLHDSRVDVKGQAITFVDLLGGIIIDRIGTKKAITAFAVICLLGAALTAAEGRPGMMIAGRTVLGLGGESIIVAATTVLAKWFKGKELSFAFGIKITISRMASVAADNSVVDDRRHLPIVLTPKMISGNWRRGWDSNPR